MDPIANLISDQFTNREIATAIWLFLLLVWVLRYTDFRMPLGNLLNASLIKSILLIFLLLGIYVSVLVFGLSKIGVWNAQNNLKDTIIWTITIGIGLIFSATKFSDTDNFFRKAIVGTFSITIFLEFIAHFHSFSLPIELVLVPFATILGVFIALGDMRQEFSLAKTLASWILALLGFIIIWHSLRFILADLNSFFDLETVIELALPPILTILFVPLIYFMALFFTYENAFLRLNLRNDDRSLISFAKRKIVLRFGLNHKKLIEWLSENPDLRVSSRDEAVKLVNRKIDPLEKVSPEAYQIAIEKPEYWEFLLTIELMRLKLDPIKMEYDDIKNGVSLYSLNRLIDKEEFRTWFQNKLKDLDDIASSLADVINNKLVIAWGESGKPGDAYKILQAIDELANCCIRSLDWEYDVQFTEFPTGFESLKPMVEGWTKQFFEEIERLSKEISRIINESPLQEETHVIDLTLTAPDNLDEASKEFKRLWKLH